MTTQPESVTGTIEQWVAERRGDAIVIVGKVYGDTLGRFPEGKLIRTSRIVSTTIREGEVVTTLNSRYRLGKQAAPAATEEPLSSVETARNAVWAYVDGAPEEVLVRALDAFERAIRADKMGDNAVVQRLIAQVNEQAATIQRLEHLVDAVPNGFTTLAAANEWAETFAAEYNAYARAGG